MNVEIEERRRGFSRKLHCLKAKVIDRRQRKRELKAWESFFIQGAFGKERVDTETLEEICMIVE